MVYFSPLLQYIFKYVIMPLLKKIFMALYNIEVRYVSLARSLFIFFEIYLMYFEFIHLTLYIY